MSDLMVETICLNVCIFNFNFYGSFFALPRLKIDLKVSIQVTVSVNFKETLYTASLI